MKARDLLLTFVAGCLASGGALFAEAASPAAKARIAGVFPRSREPAGLSALARVAGDRYLSVDDRGGWLCELAIPQNETGVVTSCSLVRRVQLAGRVDLEGCAWDPLERRVWVSDESDSSVRQFDPQTGAETAVAPLPAVFREGAVPNRSIEALAISPDGLKMYAANEDTLRCDGSVATTNRGGVVRIQEFVRAGAGRSWTATRQIRYRTRRILGADWKGHAVSGVSALAVDTDGSLLVLEREFSKKRAFPLPTFQTRLVRLGSEPEDRRVLWEGNAGFSNYEGLALGRTLPDGRRTFLLVTDAGGGTDANILVLATR